MAFDKNFNCEDLENIRILVGNKTKQIKNNIQNFESKTELAADKKEKLINEANQEYSSLILLEAKCMAQLSELIFNNCNHEAHKN